MKKKLCYVLGIMILFLVCGCSDESNNEKEENIKSWEDKIQISTLQYDNNNHVIGKMKNLTKNFYDVTLKIKAKSGSLIETVTCYELLKPNESVDLSCLTYDLDETYSLKISKVTLEEKEIPTLKEGELEVDTLEYYFPDIYENYTLNMIPFYDYFDVEYPAITGIEYKNSKITIMGSNNKNLNYTLFYFDYDTETNKIIAVQFWIDKKAESRHIEKIIENIPYMNFILGNYNSNLIKESLRRKDFKSNECALINDLCVYTDYKYTDFIILALDYRY